MKCSNSVQVVNFIYLLIGSVFVFSKIEIGGCREDPCQNNATCTDLSGGEYNCTCPAGYHGTNCETRK